MIMRSTMAMVIMMEADDDDAYNGSCPLKFQS